jgi:tetratricopeptide (TPR) repeat protein
MIATASSNSLLFGNVESINMKTPFVICVVAIMALSVSQSLLAQKNSEANKLAVQGNEAVKNKDWDTAIDTLRKATEMDHKYAPNLAAALQQRATASASQLKFPDAIPDFDEAIKLNPRNASAYEGRAYVYMKMNDMDKALADYSEAIKINPNEVRFYSYRAFILETKGDLKGAMADTDKMLKLKKGNAEAQARKARLETRLKSQNQAAPPPAPAPTAGH